MSTSEHLFFDPGSWSLDAAAQVVAEAIAAELVQRADDLAVVLPWPDGDGSALIGAFEENDYRAYDPDPSSPEDRSVFDSLPFLLRMTLVSTDESDDPQMRAGRDVFGQLVASDLGWPLVLVHEFELLVATYDVERGVREFPPGTRSDGTDERLWR